VRVELLSRGHLRDVHLHAGNFMHHPPPMPLRALRRAAPLRAVVLLAVATVMATATPIASAQTFSREFAAPRPLA
jgi:hypothetical protein